MHRSLLVGPALGAALLALPALAQPAAWPAAHPRPTQETMAGQRATILPAAVALPGSTVTWQPTLVRCRAMFHFMP